jgi:pimeloyl-ACP methyl ester carboxylesterase
MQDKTVMVWILLRPKAAISLFCGLLLLITGCASEYGVYPLDVHDRFQQLDRSALTSQKPSEQTSLFLRQRDMAREWKRHPGKTLLKLDRETRQQPSRTALFALIELSYLEARKAGMQSEKGVVLYHTCALYAYNYLFDPQLGPAVSPYDPNSRRVCEFYNRSLGAMAIYFRSKRSEIKEGARLPVLNGTVEVSGKMSELAWKPEEFDTYYLAYEFGTKGFNNHYSHFGLGVPMIVVRSTTAEKQRSIKERFLPRFRQTYGTTLITHFSPFISQTSKENPVYRAEINMYDPINTNQVNINGQPVPLENDFTTPLAYMINQTPIPSGLSGLLDMESWHEVTGMHMLQPYQPGKIPVVFVHGLMSNPETWLPMLNNLMGDPELRKKYQFWFFMYPSGSPILYSASIMRESLKDLNRLYNPDGTQAAFNRMVLIGHSMGGLLSKTMIQSGGDRLYRSVFDTPIEELELPPETKALLRQVFYFEPLPFVKRVVFIATPHRGSGMADNIVGRIGTALVSFPGKLLNFGAEIVSTAAVKPLKAISGDTETDIDRQIESIPTSIDGLSASNPVLLTLTETPFARGVPYHSIIGNHEAADTPGGTDTVVPYVSSHLEGADSEKIVHADHGAHKHPLAVLEVQRILMLHLKDVQTSE